MELRFATKDPNAKKNISAQKKKKSKNSRFSKKDANVRRAPSHKKKKSQGKKKAHGLMLPARKRAPRALFTKLRARGANAKKLESTEFEIFFEKGGSPLKVGIAVGKRIARKAVSRNRIKRIVAESLRDESDKIGGELLIVVKKDISGLKTGQVKEKLIGMLQKLND